MNEEPTNSNTDSLTDEQLAKTLTDWIEVDENYSVIHFAAEMRMSKEELFRVADRNGVFRAALEYAMTVMEYKVTEFGLGRQMDKSVVLRMLETYAGWKADVNIVQRNEYMQYMTEAEGKAQKILGASNDQAKDDDFQRMQREPLGPLTDEVPRETKESENDNEDNA